MKQAIKILIILAMLLTLSQLAYAEDMVTIEVVFTSGDTIWDTDKFVVKCVDLATGEILDMETDVGSGTRAKMKVDRSKHRFIWIYAKRYGGPVIDSEVIDLDKAPKVQDLFGKLVRLPDADDIGECGDGKKSKLEGCDSDKDCKSPTPKCIDCKRCGCGSDKDCPQMSGILPCGYGRCGPEERPVIQNYCHSDGVCIYPVTQCNYDPNCAKKNETPEEKEPEPETEEDMAALALAQQAGADKLASIMAGINENLDSVPGFARAIFANENINFYAPEPMYHIITRDGFLVIMGDGEYPEPTINVKTDEDTIIAIMKGEISFGEALESGRISYEGVGFVKSVKMGTIKLVSKVVMFFVGIF